MISVEMKNELRYKTLPNYHNRMERKKVAVLKNWTSLLYLQKNHIFTVQVKQYRFRLNLLVPFHCSGNF